MYILSPFLIKCLLAMRKLDCLQIRLRLVTYLYLVNTYTFYFTWPPYVYVKSLGIKLWHDE